MKKLAREGMAEYTGVCDLNLEAAEAFASDLGVDAVYADTEEMIKECSPHGLVILTTIKTEKTPVDSAIKAGVPFLVEKPPALTTAIHKQYMESAGDMVHLIAYNRRHSPFVVQALEWMEGTDLQAVQVSFSRYRRREKNFMSTGVHAIDTARSLAQGDLKHARLEVVRSGKVFNYFINGWTDQGVRIDIQITPDTGFAEERYIIKGDERTVAVSFPQPACFDKIGEAVLYENNECIERKTGDDFAGADMSPDEKKSALLGVEYEHELFYQALAGRAEVISTLAATYQTQILREYLEKLEMTAPDCIDFNA
jgi:predicted dehydrogenase